MRIPSSLTFLSLLPVLANAYTWQFTSQPRQCQNLSLSIEGSGQPPYNLLLLPTGPDPFQNTTEFRKIHNISFSGTNLSFKLDYPENSSFVAVVSDSSGFGSGGTSNQVTVLTSPDSSCYNPSEPAPVPWFFYTMPSGLAQCDSVQLFWNPPFVNGTVYFYGTILGGTSFPIRGPLYGINGTNIGFNGMGLNWTINIASGTQVLLIGSDDRGIGSGGKALFTIEDTPNNACLNNYSPSSTAGVPPGSYPTSTGTSTNGSTSGSMSVGKTHSSPNTGAIIGGVIGAALLVLIGLVAFWFIRRRSLFALWKERPVNVIQDDEDGNGENHWHDVPPSYAAAEPFRLRNPTIRAMSEAIFTQDRPPSTSTVSIDPPSPQSPCSPMTTTTSITRKSSSLPQLRPATIIQHDDSGRDLSDQGEPETIDLPPAYSNIRRSDRTRRRPLAPPPPPAVDEGEGDS